MEHQGLIPVRIVHNDTKANNLLIDNPSGKGICVTDLDTTMPGLTLHDFGDMVRVAANSTVEDTQDIETVVMRLEIFEAVARGYLDAAGSFLNEHEISQLVFSCKAIVLEIGMRFLKDYLDGDIYFRTSRDSHNLDRCRTQFKLVAEMEAQFTALKQIVSWYASSPTISSAGFIG